MINIISDNKDPHRYDDMLDMPHHVSPTRPHMSMYDRAAQFASFKALVGYEDMINEEARLTDQDIVLSEEEKDLIDRNFSILVAAIDNGEMPEITVTYFVPDPQKDGGGFKTHTGTLKKIDMQSKVIVFDTGLSIPVNQIKAVDSMVIQECVFP